MKYEKFLKSGDHKLIAREVPLDEIITHFGEESPEYFAWERLNVELKREWLIVYDRRPNLQQGQRTYVIPSCGEEPTVRKSTLKNWIKEFHRMNNINLPYDFKKRKFNALKEMYDNMVKDYRIKLDDIIDPWLS